MKQSPLYLRARDTHTHTPSSNNNKLRVICIESGCSKGWVNSSVFKIAIGDR